MANVLFRFHLHVYPDADYALNLSKRMYGLLTGAYIAFPFWIYLPAPYGFGRALVNLLRLEFLWIPIILYGLAAVFPGITCLIMNARTK